MENNKQMKLYYPGCKEINKQMKLYVPRFWTITNKWSCIPLGV
jgi:hypothetical protein